VATVEQRIFTRISEPMFECQGRQMLIYFSMSCTIRIDYKKRSSNMVLVNGV